MELVNKEDTVPDNSYSYARRGQNKRRFKCGKKGIDLTAIEYRSVRRKLHRHLLCEDCKKIYAEEK